MRCFVESILAEILSGEKSEKMLSMDEKWMILSSLSEICEAIQIRIRYNHLSYCEFLSRILFDEISISIDLPRLLTDELAGIYYS